MKGASVAMLLGLTVWACSNNPPPAPVTADPWLRSQTQSDCPRSACLFAVVVDSASQPINGAEIEVEGTSVRAASDAQGRVVATGIPTGTRRLRVTVHNNTLESEPLPLGATITGVVIEVRPFSIVLKR